MTFSDQIKSFNKKAKKAAEAVLRGSAFEIFSHIILRTPVGQYDDGKVGGRLRGNWQTDINNKPSGEVETNEGEAISLAKNKTGFMNLGDSIFMFNNLPYVLVVENGQYPQGKGATKKTTSSGYSSQAPAGMVKVTIAEWKATVAKMARKK